MAWSARFELRAVAELRKLDRTAQERIIRYLQERVATGDSSRARGKALVGGAVKLWRYRIGDYRAICMIDDENQLVLVLRVAHRKEAYR